ncbi:hypothetical protein ABZP36_000550 [Zizania latifolia]
MACPPCRTMLLAVQRRPPRRLRVSTTSPAVPPTREAAAQAQSHVCLIHFGTREVASGPGAELLLLSVDAALEAEARDAVALGRRVRHRVLEKLLEAGQRELQRTPAIQQVGGGESFGDAVAKSKGSLEKLFVLLDMYEVMHELQSEVEVIFEGKFCSEMREAAIARQSLEALEYLHQLRIIHCNLKPENILIKSNSMCGIKVIDPGKLYTGDVLFSIEPVPIMLIQMIGIIGPIDMEMLELGEETQSGSLSSIPVSAPKVVPSASESAVATTTGKDVGPSNLSSNEDDAEEEVPCTSSDLNLGWEPLFRFIIYTDDQARTAFRPASLNIPSAQPAQPSQSISSSTFSSAFSSELSGFGQSVQIGSGKQLGFGQPAQIGAGQQAEFGQPAQVGVTQKSGFGQPAQIGTSQQSGFEQQAQFGAWICPGFFWTITPVGKLWKIRTPSGFADTDEKIVHLFPGIILVPFMPEGCSGLLCMQLKLLFMHLLWIL